MNVCVCVLGVGVFKKCIRKGVGVRKVFIRCIRKGGWCEKGIYKVYQKRWVV